MAAWCAEAEPSHRFLWVMSRARAVSPVAHVPHRPDLVPSPPMSVRPLVSCLRCPVTKSVASHALDAPL
jgi:hypothetical protein